MPDNQHAVNRDKHDQPQDVVFVTAGQHPIWSGHDFISLEHFLDDLDALGFAVWVTPSVVYVFTGEE